jgi:hypothetical protein
MEILGIRVHLPQDLGYHNIFLSDKINTVAPCCAAIWLPPIYPVLYYGL